MQKASSEHPALPFLKALYQNCESSGFIDLRFILKPHKAIEEFVALSQLESIIPTLTEKYKAKNIYFGISLRKGNDGSKAGIVLIPALWCDIDFKDTSQEEFRRIYSEFPLKASAAIRSGNGYHLYWFLREPAGPEDIARIESLLRRLASSLRGDNWSAEVAHLLRAPGTLNYKYNPPAEVTVGHVHPETQYSLDDFEGILPREEGPATTTVTPREAISDRLQKIMECDFLQHSDRDRATLPEPHWYAMACVLARETGGVDLIHQLSQGYPKYSRKETDDKILHALKDSGPITCSKIKELWDCGRECGVTSPVLLAVRTKSNEPAGQATVDQEWPDPVSFDSCSFLPDFPTDALPGTGREMVEAVSEVNQVDPALAACAYIGITSASCAKKGTVDLETHREPCNLYLCPISESGERKSKTISDMARPLIDFQTMKEDEIRDGIREAQNTFRIKEKRLEKLQKRAAEDDDPEQRRQFEREAAELAREMAENPVPKRPTLLVDDITIEKLGVLMAENDERLAVVSPEGGLFEIMAGRYSNDGTGNFELLLKAHAGDPWRSDRIGRESKTMLSPALTLCLAVQPGVIEDVGKNKHFRERGLDARFLFAKCKTHAGDRKRNGFSMPMALARRYRDHVFSLLEIPSMDTILRLSPEAQRLWDEFYDDVEKEMKPEGSLFYLRDWGSKLPGAVARISGLLHFAEHGVKGLSLPISVNSVSASCVIGGYFKEHAVAVFGMMKEDPRIKLARQILDYLKRHMPERFKGRDVMHHTAIALMDEVEQGLKILIDRGYIREETGLSNNPGPGRPSSKTYRVNPKLFEGRNV